MTAPRLTDNMTTPTIDIHKLFGLIGFEYTGTGGGCTAFIFKLEDKDDGYILVTDGDDCREAEAPIDTTVHFVVGRYSNTADEDYEDFDVGNLNAALDRIEKYAGPIANRDALIKDATYTAEELKEKDEWEPVLQGVTS